MTVGIVYIVGAGPGDPELITVKGLACIRRADVLVYDRLVSPALVAQAPSGCELVYVGKEHGCHGQKQADINGLLADRAIAGKVVCRLKGGDPFVFGRGGEEAELLAALRVPFEVVPGITAGIAAPAYAGIPVTHRDVAGSVTLVTGHDAPTKRGPAIDWGRLATGSETLLIYMGVEGLGQTAERLIQHGRAPETPVAVIRWGTKREQQTVTGTLLTIAERVKRAGIKSPAMIVVGEVVNLRQQIAWAEGRPLFGQRVLIPTFAVVEPAAADQLRQAGAEVWVWPVLDSGYERRIDLADPLREALSVGDIDAVLLTDPALVAPFLALVGERKLLDDLRILSTDERTAIVMRSADLSGEAVVLKDLRSELRPLAIVI
jgi:uroporphyrinogen III methyltransferase/synthase